MEYMIIILIISLTINVVAATEFESIAKMKGHKGYFWWCVLLGIIGWMMVVALPDRGKASSPDGAKAYGEAENNDTLPEL